MQLNGEVELDNGQREAVNIVLTDQHDHPIKTFTSNTNGTFNLQVALGKKYKLVVSKYQYQKEVIHINANLSKNTEKPLWPVYVKVKLKSDVIGQKYESYIYFDEEQNRFDHKVENPIYKVQQKVFSEPKVVVDSALVRKTTSSSSTSSSSSSSSIKKIDEEEEKFLRETSNQELKSSKQKEILETIKKSKQNKEFNVKDPKIEAEKLLAKMEQSRKNRVYKSIYNKDLNQEYELEYGNMTLKSNEKRKFIEEVSDTKKDDKQKVQNYTFDK